MRKGVGFLGKDIQNRLDERYKDDKKPNDLIQWLIDAAPPIEKTVYQIVERVMALNVASIHTTTMVRLPLLEIQTHTKSELMFLETFTPAIYTLAAQSSRYIDILRNEVVENLENGQITNNTVQNLVHIDSFLRESARFSSNGLGESSPRFPSATSTSILTLIVYQSGYAEERKAAIRLFRWHIHSSGCKAGCS